jgi:hypothetical protein
MRVTVIALLLAANALLWSWGQDHFATLGWPSPNYNNPAADADLNAVFVDVASSDRLSETTLNSTPELPTRLKGGLSHGVKQGNSAALPRADSPASAESSTLETTISTSISEQNSAKRTPHVTSQVTAKDAETAATPVGTQPAPYATDAAARSEVIASAITATKSDQTLIGNNTSMGNGATFTGQTSVVCWRVRTWPLERQEQLQRALLDKPADAVWRIVAHELPERWLAMVPTGNTSLAQRSALLKNNTVDFRVSEQPVPPGLIVGTFKLREGAIDIVAKLKRLGIPVEVVQERPPTPVWELRIFADHRATVDALLERVKDLPRYADSPLRVSPCAN